MWLKLCENLKIFGDEMNELNRSFKGVKKHSLPRSMAYSRGGPSFVSLIIVMAPLDDLILAPRMLHASNLNPPPQCFYISED